MKLLAIAGSIALFVYIIGVLALTFHNVSKGMWALETGEPRLIRFFMREIMIVLWPLVVCSEEGRHALRVIWTGRDGSGGVDPQPVRTGSEVVASSTDAIYISTTPTAFDVEFFGNVTPMVSTK